MWVTLVKTSNVEYFFMLDSLHTPVILMIIINRPVEKLIDNPHFPRRNRDLGTISVY